MELGAFERFYDERPFEGRSYPGPYFETEIASGMKRGLAVSVEGPTVDDARALMDQVRAIIARPLPTHEMYSALLETFPKAFPWNTPRQMSYAVTPSAICVGRRETTQSTSTSTRKTTLKSTIGLSCGLTVTATF
ncbi:hypothetical protein AB1285_27370 [Microbacterium sp. NRRL B-14842]|uniref:hypothetical protein n=1 Tax=Microbacterium sp. NRRL B-14842 TaxID=3162881 RepID=UPI003D28EFB8